VAAPQPSLPASPLQNRRKWASHGGSGHVSRGDRDLSTARSGRWQITAGAWVLLAVPLLLASGAAAEGGPTPEEYVKQVGGDARIVPAGMLTLDGYKFFCGTRPTVLDSTLDDFAAAYPTFLILNPKLLAKIKSLPVKLWIYAHECGHQFRGPDEETADCFAVQRGRRQGWLTPEGLEDVCAFITPAKASNVHSGGAKRCEAMRACYADRSIR
jgi:hypothetical protein